jgi:hypothetical protein
MSGDFESHCTQLLSDGFAAEMGATVLPSGAVNFFDQRRVTPATNHRLAFRSRPRHEDCLTPF